MEIITYDIIDMMFGSILLNSSKQTHKPVDAKPLKNRIILEYSKLELQFMTKHDLAIYFAKSLVVSVLPVPTGPSGAPP